MKFNAQWNSKWWDNQPHGMWLCSMVFFIPHLGEMRPFSTMTVGKRPLLLWNALLTTLYIKLHDKSMFLLARDLYEMFVLYNRKHTTQRSTVGIWKWNTSILCTGHEYIVHRRFTDGQQPEKLRLKYSITFSNSNNTSWKLSSSLLLSESFSIWFCLT